eukprot:RCo032248
MVGHRQEMMELAKGLYARAKSVPKLAWLKVQWELKQENKRRHLLRREYKFQRIHRLDGAARECGLPYERFWNGVRRSGMALDRKVLGELAVSEPMAFRAVVEVAREALLEHRRAVLLATEIPERRAEVE